VKQKTKKRKIRREVTRVLKLSNLNLISRKWQRKRMSPLGSMDLQTTITVELDGNQRDSS